MAQEVRDFDDIVDMVMEELKLQSDDDTSRDRIKRDVNAVYLNEVVPRKRWNWLAGHTKVQHKAYYNAGTCSVTPESTTVTLSVAPALATGSRAGYLFSVDGFDEIYTISAHTAGSTTITLSSQYNGALNTTASYKIWTDTIALPTDCKETVEVWQDFHRNTMEALGLQEFRKRVRESPKSAAKPVYYHTYDFYDPTSGTAETESDRYRVMKVHPSLISDTITLHVDYVKEATALDLDGDEPLMPMEDRLVLVYGALARAWKRERNPEAAADSRYMFEQKLAQMMGKIEDGFDKPQLKPDDLYVAKKRGPRRSARGRLWSTGSGGNSYTSPTYITNATIGSGNTLTANLSVDSGITIDGVDISALASSVTTLSTLADGKIYIGNSSNAASEVTPTGDVTISNLGVTAITADSIVNADINSSAGIAYSKLALTNSILNADINSTAAIAYSKLNLASSIVNADVSGTAAIAYSKLNLTGSILNADINASAAIARSKIATGTTNRLVVNDGATGALSDAAAITASRAVVSDANGIPTHATTTATEIGYVNGVTSAIQTQLDGKQRKFSRTTTAADYTVLTTDFFVGVTSNAAARTITLPSAASCSAGQVFIIKDEAGTAASANNITVARAGSDTIDGATSVLISSNYGVLRLYCDGSAAFFSF